MSSNLPQSSVDRENPWPGLATFTEAQRAFFHGRDEEIRELTRRLERKTLTVLFGQSGLGKSSLLQAGVFPRLRSAGYCPIYVRLDHSPDALPLAEQIKPTVTAATSLMGVWSQGGVAVAGESLWEYFHHRDDILRGGSGQLLIPLLVFDQFEELFTLGAAADSTRARAQAFLTELADLVENRPPASFEARLDAGTVDAEKFDFTRSDYRVLISLREDYLPHLESLKGAMPSLMQNRLRLKRLSGTQALEAVVNPAPGLVTEDVARAIVTFVSGRTDLTQAEVEPSLLSLVCRELNHRRQAVGATAIDAALLDGSRETILVEFYERTLADQPNAVRHFIEDELLTDSGYRENIALERAQKLLATAGAPSTAIDTLVARRLLRIEKRLDVRRIELTHDVLCGVVKASRAIRQEREARAAEEQRRQASAAQLLAAQESATKAQRSAQRSRFVAVGSSVLAVVAIGAAIWGYINLRRAEAAESHISSERDRAQVARGEAEKLVSFLLDDLYRQLESTGRTAVVSSLASRALAYFEALPPEFRDARSERYRGVALSRLGMALSMQGKTREAEEPMLAAEALFKGLRDQGDKTVGLAVDLTALLRQRSKNAYAQNRITAGIEISKRAVEFIGTVTAGPDATDEARFEQGRSLTALGFLLMRDDQDGPALATFQQALMVLKPLIAHEPMRQRASVMFSECASWTAEVMVKLQHITESRAMLAEAVPIIDAAVEREAGNLGALRSRALLQGNKARLAREANDDATVVKLGLKGAEDWTEFLRYDRENDTARNNRRAQLGSVAGAYIRQGQVSAAIETLKRFSHDGTADASAPSTLRVIMFQVAWHTTLEAELGRTTDIETNVAEFDRLGALAINQVGAESFIAADTQVWKEALRANLKMATGQTAAALKAAQENLVKTKALVPASAGETQLQRNMIRQNLGLQTSAALKLERWAEAAQAGQELIAAVRRIGKNTDEEDNLNEDFALAAVALAKNGELETARKFWDQAKADDRAHNDARASNTAILIQRAMLALGDGLITKDPIEKRAAFSAGLTHIAAIPAEAQQLRRIRDLKIFLQQELAKIK